MDPIAQLKESTVAQTPLLLFDVEFHDGERAGWSTHEVTIDARSYQARVLRHNVLEVQAASEGGIDGIPRIVLTLANADSALSQLHQAQNLKGARIQATFLFFDLESNTPATESTVVFQGQLNPPEEITEGELRLTAVNRMSMQRVLFPPVRIQRRCPWSFPSNAAERQDAVSGGAEGRFSRFYACGYSAGESGGVGSLGPGGQPFTQCSFTRSDCQERGMFDRDSGGETSRRFGGVEFVPPAIAVRSYGSRDHSVSKLAVNEARYNDFVPLAYGTVWIEPPVVFARNDGNLTRMEVLLASGEIHRVQKVVVNNIEIPVGLEGVDMTGGGWWNLFAGGGRTGGFNLNFTKPDGTPLGDPYGGMSALSVVVPNQVHGGSSLPRVQVLLDGLKLAQYDGNGDYVETSFSNNPAWVLLDVLRRSGWRSDELDLGSFAIAAAVCEEPIAAFDNAGNQISIRRFECNLAVKERRTAAEVVRAIRNCARMQLSYQDSGAIAVFVEDSLLRQQPSKPEGSNALTELNGGWAAYHYTDGSLPEIPSGFLTRADGSPAIRLYSRSIADTPNRYSIEFADQFNEFQQDSLDLIDAEDVARTGREVAGRLVVDGIASYDQAARILKFYLDKSISGNTFIEFETSVKAIGQKIGDIIAITYLKEGLLAQPFRILKLAPNTNYRRVRITAQIHDDAWYVDTNGQLSLTPPTSRQPDPGTGVPGSLYGDELDEHGEPAFGLQEFQTHGSDGTILTELEVRFRPPSAGRSLSVGVPSISLTTMIASVGGSIEGGQTLYYAVTAIDDGGLEGNPSFVVRAEVDAGSTTNTVTLQSMRFTSEAVSFNVYRGPTPSRLFRIATEVPVAQDFVDTGFHADLDGAPSPYYDHANFYWRQEDVPEQFASIYSNNSIGSSQLSLVEDALVGRSVRILRGKGAGQERKVIGNTVDTLVVEPDWELPPDPSSAFVAAEGTWHFGGRARSSPARFQVPNVQDRVIQVTGRSANVNNVESLEGLALITRWRIGGGGLGVSDYDAPPEPGFGLVAPGDGSVTLGAVAFTTLENTQSVRTGVFRYWYRDELQLAAPATLSGAVDAESTTLLLGAAISVAPDDLLLVDSEVMKVLEVKQAGAECEVGRGRSGSTPTAHAGGAEIHVLSTRTESLSFEPNFFGRPESANWAHTIWAPGIRIACAEMTVSNAFGPSPAYVAGFSELIDSGLRTLRGGQYNFQIEGTLSIANEATPSLVVQNTVSVRDIFATVKAAPMGADVTLDLRKDGALYSTLVVPDGQLSATPGDGGNLPPLTQGSVLELDIVSVGTQFPGQDLTLTVRL